MSHPAGRAAPPAEVASRLPRKRPARAAAARSLAEAAAPSTASAISSGLPEGVPVGLAVAGGVALAAYGLKQVRCAHPGSRARCAHALRHRRRARNCAAAVPLPMLAPHWLGARGVDAVGPQQQPAVRARAHVLRPPHKGASQPRGLQTQRPPGPSQPGFARGWAGGPRHTPQARRRSPAPGRPSLGGSMQQALGGNWVWGADCDTRPCGGARQPRPRRARARVHGPRPPPQPGFCSPTPGRPGLILECVKAWKTWGWGGQVKTGSRAAARATRRTTRAPDRATHPRPQPQPCISNPVPGHLDTCVAHRKVWKTLELGGQELTGE